MYNGLTLTESDWAESSSQAGHSSSSGSARDNKTKRRAFVPTFRPSDEKELGRNAELYIERPESPQTRREKDAELHSLLAEVQELYRARSWTSDEAVVEDDTNTDPALQVHPEHARSQTPRAKSPSRKQSNHHPWSQKAYRFFAKAQQRLAALTSPIVVTNRIDELSLNNTDPGMSQSKNSKRTKTGSITPAKLNVRKGGGSKKKDPYTDERALFGPKSKLVNADLVVRIPSTLLPNDHKSHL